MDKITKAVFDQYQIKITSNPELETDTFVSVNPLLDTLIELHNSIALASKLYNEIYVANNQQFLYILIAHLPVAGTVECIPVLEAEQHTKSDHLVLPIADMLAITKEWQARRLWWIRREFEVKNGQGIIRIINDDQSNALIIQKPTAINWPDCRGSIGEYYAVSTYDLQQRKALTQQLDEVLISGSNRQIMDQMESFLQLFEDGKYSVHLGKLEMEGSEVIFDLESNLLSKEKELFAANFYPYGDGQIYLASRPKDSIDPQRVAYYEELIRNGARPRVVVYTHYLSHDYVYCNHYIIDGHHKLMAYINLKINPYDVYISRDCYDMKMSSEVISTALNILNPPAFRHFLINSSEENLSGLLPTEVTHMLDEFLRTEKYMDTNIAQNIRRAYLDPTHRTWAEARLVVLGQNKYINKGLILPFVHQAPQTSYGIWHRYPINSLSDFQEWKETYLEDKPISMKMSKLLFKPVEQIVGHSNEASNTTDISRHLNSTIRSESLLGTREVILLIVIFLALIQLIARGC